MGQEYSQDLNSVTYPQAIGYIEKNRLKGRKKYNLKKVEIKSFNTIPYSKYVPLSERNTSTYQKSLKPNTRSQQNNNDRKPGGRIVNIAPSGGYIRGIGGSPTNRRKFAVNPGNSSNQQKVGKSPVGAYKDKKASSKTTGSNNVSFSSQTTQGSRSTVTSAKGSKKSVTSPNTSLVSVKERHIKSASSVGSRQKFVARTDKEVQLTKIYIKPDDFVVEIPKHGGKSKKKGKSESGDFKISKKKKALFKIRKKMKIEPTPVYVESPFKRQTTIRIKKNQIRPNVRKPIVIPDANTIQTESRPNTARTEREGPATDKSEPFDRPNTAGTLKNSNKRPESAASSMSLSIVGTKAGLHNKDTAESLETHKDSIDDEKDELTKLFQKRTRAPPEKPAKVVERQRRLSDGDVPRKSANKAHQGSAKTNKQSNNTNNNLRPKSSPYNTLPYSPGGVLYPGYKGKSVNQTTSKAPKKRTAKSAVYPMLTRSPSKSAKMKGKIGNIAIVKGKNTTNKQQSNQGGHDPKVRLKWFNVLHRTHYENRVGSIYNKDDDNNHNILGNDEDDNESLQHDEDGDQDQIHSSRSANTYSDSCLTNTTVSSAKATVVGELDHNIAEVESVTSEFSVFSTRQSNISGPADYEGDGETDLDRPLRFKLKKSPNLLRKDLLKMEEFHNKNNPGLDDSDSDSSTLTGEEYPSVGHVQKMRELFGALQYNKNHPPSRHRQSRHNEHSEQVYKPSFMNESTPAHLFVAKQEKGKNPGDTNKTELKKEIGTSKSADVSGTVSKSKARMVKSGTTQKSGKSTVLEKLKVVSNSKNNSIKNNNKVDNNKKTVSVQSTKPKPVKIPDFLKAKPQSSVKRNSSPDKSISKPMQVSSAKQSGKIVETAAVEEIPIHNTVRQIIVSPVHSDDDAESLANLEDAATLAAQQSRKAHMSHQQDYARVNGTNSYDYPDPNSNDAKDELDEVLMDILSEQKSKTKETHKDNSSKVMHVQVDGPFRIESAKSAQPRHVFSYSTPVHQPDYNKPSDEPPPSDQVFDYNRAKAVFEADDKRKQPLFNGHKNVMQVMPNTTGEEPNNLHSEEQHQPQSKVTIEGNYDNFARTKIQSNEGSSNNKAGVRFPRIVNKDLSAMYSRHGGAPTPSKSGPTMTKSKPAVSDRNKSISTISDNYKSPRYNKGYTWKAATDTSNNKTTAKNSATLYTTLVKNGYQENGNDLNHDMSNTAETVQNSGAESIHRITVVQKTAEVTKM